MSLGQPTEFASAIARSLSKEPFVLLDIGCSGGINPMWRIFGDRLLALGVDPNIEEVERLKAREKSTRVEYIAAFVGKSGRPHLTASTELLVSQSLSLPSAELLANSGDTSKRDQTVLVGGEDTSECMEGHAPRETRHIAGGFNRCEKTEAR